MTRRAFGATTALLLFALAVSGMPSSRAWAQAFSSKPITLIDAGQARMPVVWTEQRSPRFSDFPTSRESGIDIVTASPLGLVGPKGMDPKVVKIPHDAFQKALHDPAHRKMLTGLSQPVMYLNNADPAKFAMQQIKEQQDMIALLGLGQK